MRILGKVLLLTEGALVVDQQQPDFDLKYPLCLVQLPGNRCPQRSAG